MRKLLLLTLLFTNPVHASEVTLVKSDNTTIRTVHIYGNSQMEMETESVPENSSAFATAECLDKAKQQTTRQKRMAEIDNCLAQEDTVAIGSLA